ncbi:transcriptional regulator [Curtobacterium sp. MCJR17_055]|uniref:RNA-binding domain-containing protein n=1 Tax=unclassified Curtobacterium TaxID=257496 RepID=UPI000D84B1E9|nr:MULTISPECIES: RNA-binding domain-containing protein [unclassified Curtobacterium]PYY37732.1 transcriptional regulator [Curtobacterium sp. MCBD17_029]PYY56760.1 transcriptional regulator [Curtobacterium sp. MCJR17_055]PYY62326.1 transcriptional regulator [Curtobacterium sp. MCPF17_015]
MDDLDGLLEQILAGRAEANDLESESVDFKREQKSQQDTANDMADAAACFANANGGTIVLGVADRGTGRDAFLGTALDPQYLRRRIYDVTKPSLDVSVRPLQFAGVQLLVIEVREGLEVYSSRLKMPSKRVGHQCEPMSTAQVSRLDDDRRGGDWSAASAGRPLSDVDRDAVDALRFYVRRAANESLLTISDAPLQDLVGALGLLHERGDLNRAGAMLLCGPDDGREVLSYQHRISAGGETDLGRRWNGPLLVAYAELIALLEARIGTTPVNLRSGQQVQIEDYPLAAVREAVTNALMHGDHRDRRPIQVEHSPQALTVMSPGPLVPGISPENILTHPPKARFPALADALRSLGLAEKWGQGVDRMFREMIRSGRSVPLVSVRTGDEPETIVQLLGGPPNTRITKFVADLPEQDQNDTDVLLLVSYLTTNRTVTAAKLAQVVQRQVDAAQSLLTRIANDEAGFLEPTAGTKNARHPTYRFRGASIAALGPAITYQARPDTDRAKKVTDHVREYETVNNATVQRMFDVDVYAARDILRDLVDRDVLTRVSEQRRGPAVKYGPGPSFPQKQTGRRAR